MSKRVGKNYETGKDLDMLIKVFNLACELFEGCRIEATNETYDDQQVLRFAIFTDLDVDEAMDRLQKLEDDNLPEIFYRSDGRINFHLVFE